MSDGNARSILSRISPKKSVEQTENTPYEIPDTWAWVKLADLYTINPKVDAGDAKDAAFIPMERVGAGFNRTFSFERQSWVQASKNHTKFSDGDVAFAKISPCFENRKSFIAQGLPNGIGGGTTELIVLRQGEMLPEYTYYLVLDQRFIATGKASYKGTVGQQRVQSDVIKNYFVPVPPYPEQQRIVEKIEQAFSALDSIDALQAKYADNLAVLKSKLIDAAIRGKLTNQLPEDGTAEELYRQIQAEKDELAEKGELYREKTIKKISPEEIPYAIPQNWIWTRLGELSKVITKGSSPKWQGVNYTDADNGILFITSENVGNGRMLFDKRKYVQEQFNEIHPSSILQKGDILTNIVGASIGRTALFDEDTDNANTNQAVCIVRLINKDVSAYILRYLCSNGAIQLMIGKVVDTARANLSLTSISNLMVPLPPLAEQQRIVMHLDEILKMIET